MSDNSCCTDTYTEGIKAGATAERASIVALLSEPTDALIRVVLQAAGTPDEVIDHPDVRREMRAAIQAVGKFIERYEYASGEGESA